MVTAELQLVKGRSGVELESNADYSSGSAGKAPGPLRGRLPGDHDPARADRAQRHAGLVRFGVVERVLHHLLHLLLGSLIELGCVHFEASGPTPSHKRNRNVTIGIVTAVIG
jgi:hypothetical protein